METTQLTWINYFAIIAPIFVGLVGISLGFYMNYITLKTKKREDERRDIYQKLNEFYGPFDHLRKKSLRLYNLLVKSMGKENRTLLALLNGEKFKANDKRLLEEIISIDRQLEALILQKSGLIDDGEIRELLAKAATHFSIISQAFDGKLTGEADRFKDYVFPTELDEKISSQIILLKGKLKDMDK